MENQIETQKGGANGCLIIVGFFVVLFFGLWGYFEFVGNDCVRSIPDGTVRCKCDMPSKQAWDDYLETAKGSYESVTVDGKECGD
jgi:hypothetical protein